MPLRDQQVVFPSCCRIWTRETMSSEFHPVMQCVENKEKVCTSDCEVAEVNPVRVQQLEGC